MCLPLDTQRPYCRISVRGALNDSWADYLGDLCQDIKMEDGYITSTTLTGQPIDLLAYVGMLSTVANWGLTVLAAEYELVAPCGAGTKSDDEDG